MKNQWKKQVAVNVGNEDGFTVPLERIAVIEFLWFSKLMDVNGESSIIILFSSFRHFTD